ncbi:MAG: Alkaline phosphatase synthesis transcriptional regulatory protein PhoP [Bryobacteraceae bacterium]|nr:Alkaline phosphatase synthesis transcriptional regulatory protein PhoP [Bryobacteraceae bacterium]MCC6341539.1 response regulator transcription factor [Bryobacterales bacterium]
MGSQILLVEDEPGLVLTLTDLLASEGYQADTASDGPSGLEKAAGGSYRLIILDVMLPGKSGLEVCRELRQQGLDTAILMLTARTQVHDRVAGLRNGADDYLTKPFHPSELLARVDALMRRVHKEKLLPVHRFEFGAIEVDFERSQVRKGRTPLSLAGKELQLLRYLIDRRGKVVSRDELLRNVWEYQSGISTRTVDVHVAWLRQKLEENPQNPRHILTVRGAGYRFVQ